jgi:hypothetical protein
MNIFYLDKNPEQAAQLQHDKHVVKMIIEIAQLLCTAHRFLDGEMYIDKTATGRKIKRWKLDNELNDVLYLATHINHPSAIWARQTKGNYAWLYRHFIALCDEYTYRYGKVHLTDTKLRRALAKVPENIDFTGVVTKMPQAMPDVYKTEDSVQAYKNYYIAEKKNQSRYTKRDTPAWLI